MRCLLALVTTIAMLTGSWSAAQSTATDIVADVRAAIASRGVAAGESLLEGVRASAGTTPEVLAAMSWLARGALAAGQFGQAGDYADETYDLAVAQLESRQLDDDDYLPTALGAAIEVRAFVGAELGARSESVAQLQRELERYQGTSIHKRIQKNLNVLSLQGQLPPALEGREVLGQPLPAFDALEGKVALLFFWAHWCSDCKVQGPIIASLLDKYAQMGFVVVAPTQRYGYVGGGREAGPDEELEYIAEIRQQYYGFLDAASVPLDEANHLRYGVSSTPTLVLVGREGLVRLYHPGRMTEQELESAIIGLL